MLAAVAQAKILVISDIDDTIKVSNVLSKKRAAVSALDDDSRFVGMSEIYRMLKESHDDIEFHYVSLAPKLVMGHQHKEFIEENKFPLTALHMNSGIKQDPQLKQKVIRQLLIDKKPEMVIYFGDNGQFDTIVYNDMTKEFPQIPSVTYIREAYSKLADSEHPTLPGQIGFVTSVEVTIDLINRAILPLTAYEPIEKLVYKRLQKDDGNENFGPMVFPGWQDCRDFKWIWTIKNPPQKLQEIRAAIASKCGQ
jgi:phosphatidate phosphatase APP1